MYIHAYIPRTASHWFKICLNESYRDGMDCVWEAYKECAKDISVPGQQMVNWILPTDTNKRVDNPMPITYRYVCIFQLLTVNHCECLSFKTSTT